MDKLTQQLNDLYDQRNIIDEQIAYIKLHINTISEKEKQDNYYNTAIAFSEELKNKKVIFTKPDMCIIGKQCNEEFNIFHYSYKLKTNVEIPTITTKNVDNMTCGTHNMNCEINNIEPPSNKIENYLYPYLLQFFTDKLPIKIMLYVYSDMWDGNAFRIIPSELSNIIWIDNTTKQIYITVWYYGPILK